ncbi:hypothetical protein ACFYNO_19780 [Kitasatospora sp. NPDC006697]|uniref:hypothetical protein n=1 Tax=Kitasatospora sp. NPDC006697 TaxID=3364020 RepID=UPI0036B7F737
MDTPSPSVQPAPTPAPAAAGAELTSTFVASIGGNAGLGAVGGGLLVASGGGALWLKRRYSARKGAASAT